MNLVQFLFGSGWSIAWHLLFYIGTVPALVFLSLLRKNKQRQTVLLTYAIASIVLLIFSSIHTVAFTIGWKARPLMKYPTAAIILFGFCVMAWMLIPYLLQRSRAIKIAGVHLVVGAIVFLNMWSLWHVQLRARQHTIHAETFTHP